MKEALDWIGKLGPWGPVIFVGIYVLGSLVNVGAGHRQRTAGEWALYGVGLLAAIVVTVFVTRLAKKALAKKISGNENGPNPQGV